MVDDKQLLNQALALLGQCALLESRLPKVSRHKAKTDLEAHTQKFDELIAQNHYMVEGIEDAVDETLSLVDSKLADIRYDLEINNGFICNPQGEAISLGIRATGVDFSPNPTPYLIKGMKGGTLYHTRDLEPPLADGTNDWVIKWWIVCGDLDDVSLPWTWNDEESAKKYL